MPSILPSHPKGLKQFNMAKKKLKTTERAIRSALSKLGRTAKAIALSLKKLKIRAIEDKNKSYSESCPLGVYLNNIFDSDIRVGSNYIRFLYFSFAKNKQCNEFTGLYDHNHFPELKPKGTK